VTWATCPLWKPCAPPIPGPEAVFDFGWVAVVAFLWLLIFHVVGLGEAAAGRDDEKGGDRG
jgi:hypothetical protein